MIKSILFKTLYPIFNSILRYLARKEESEKLILNKILSDINFLMGKGFSGPNSITDEVKSVKRILNSNIPTHIIDVGASSGEYTDTLIKEFPDVKIICFEPSKISFEVINSKFKNNKNIICEKIALSDRNGESYLYSNSPGSRLGSLTKRKLDHFNIEFEYKEIVKLNKLDTYLEKATYNSKIDFMKLDAEGHELEILKGASKSLKKIKLIQFEFGGSNIDSKTYFQDFWYFFKENNFKLYRITPFGPAQIRKYQEEDEYFKTTNYLALNKSLL